MAFHLTPEMQKKYGLPKDPYRQQIMLTAMSGADRTALGHLTHSPERVKEAQAIVLRTVTKFEEWARAEYDLPKEWHVVVWFDWSIRRRRSMGGSYSGRARSYELTHRIDAGPRISMCMNGHIPLGDRKKDMTFHEYKSFQDDHEIGSFTGSWQDCLRVLTIHECAHGVQFTKKKLDKSYKAPERAGHRSLWKDIYRAARKQFGFVTEAPTPAETEEEMKVAAEK